jgi:hypothetical protein
MASEWGRTASWFFVLRLERDKKFLTAVAATAFAGSENLIRGRAAPVIVERQEPLDVPVFGNGVEFATPVTA